MTKRKMKMSKATGISGKPSVDQAELPEESQKVVVLALYLLCPYMVCIWSVWSLHGPNLNLTCFYLVCLVLSPYLVPT